MDCSKVVDLLLQNLQLIAMLPVDKTGHPAIYQILSPESELFPRIAVFESARAYTAFADDAPIEERSEFRLDIYARENVLFEMSTLLLTALTVEGFTRYATIQDDYLPEQGIYVKSVVFEYHEQLDPELEPLSAAKEEPTCNP